MVPRLNSKFEFPGGLVCAIIAISAVTMLFSSDPARADRIDDLYIMAMEAEDNASSKNDYEKAVSIYSEITESFSGDENGELIAASLFSVGDICCRRLSDYSRAVKAFERIIRAFPGTSWVGRAESEISKLKDSHPEAFGSGRGSSNARASMASAISGFGLDGNLGAPAGSGSRSGTASSGFDNQRASSRDRGVADSSESFPDGLFSDARSGLSFHADPMDWIVDQSIPQPGFLAFIRPRDGGVKGYPNATLTRASASSMTSASYADKVKEEAQTLLQGYKVVAEQDISVAGMEVHEIFSYYVNNDMDLLQKQTFVVKNGEVFTLTCTDLKNNFLGSLEKFKNITGSIGFSR